MSDCVTDTHSLVWYFARPQRLGPHAAEAFAQVEAGTARLIVPVIVIAELILLLEHKPTIASLEFILRQLQASPNSLIPDLTLIRTLDLRTLTALPDIHDRLIVAEAVARDLPLITNDRAITASGLVKVIW